MLTLYGSSFFSGCILEEDISSLTVWLVLRMFVVFCWETSVRGSSILRDNLSLLLLWLRLIALASSYLRRGLGSLVKVWWSLSGVLIASFMVNKLLLFYITFELSLIPILLILLYLGRQPERLSAGIYFLAYTLTLSLPFIGLVLLVTYQVFLRRRTLELPGLISLIALGPFLVKMPVFGLHYWLPKAHVEANTRGSIILAGLLLKLGSYGIVRLFFLFNMSVILIWRRGLWILLASVSRVITLIQSDLKKFVAYRRVAHITFIIIGLVRERKLIFIRAVIMSLAHGWASIGIFMVAGAVRQNRQSRLRLLSARESSLSWFLLLLGAALLINASVPPFPSFFPEALIVHFLKSVWSLGVLLFVFASFIVCYYNSFLFLRVRHKKSLRTSASLVLSLEGVTLLMLIIVRGITLLGFRLHFELLQTVTLLSCAHIKASVLGNTGFGTLKNSFNLNS